MSKNVEKNILTKDGVNSLEKELKRLIEIERPKVIQEIKDARAQGDLSENAEFDAAREKQGVIEDRIKEIENILENSLVLSNVASKGKVKIGNEVTILDLFDNSEHIYKIVGSLEANPFEKKISNLSPLALALVGSSEGDVVTIDTEKKYEVKILKIK